MKWILWALGLGIFLNGSSMGGTSWPIGSVVAVVIMGVYIKTSQDRQFEEIKEKLERLTRGEAAEKDADQVVNENRG